MLLGVTGGIATGKSSFCRMLMNHRHFVFFDADSCVHELLSGDVAVSAAVLGAFGPAVFSASGDIDRAALRSIVFADSHRRQELEGILHPIVRQRWLDLGEQCSAEGRDLLADIPLLFETDAGRHFDATIAIGASAEIQKSRLLSRGLDASIADAMLASQWPVNRKIALASFVIWNDGTLAALEKQAIGLLASLSFSNT